MEIIYPIATVILAIGLAYGGISYLTRNKAKDRQADAATRRAYNAPTRDDPDPS